MANINPGTCNHLHNGPVNGKVEYKMHSTLLTTTIEEIDIGNAVSTNKTFENASVMLRG